MTEKKRRIDVPVSESRAGWTRIPEELARTISSFADGKDAVKIARLARHFSRWFTLDKLVIPTTDVGGLLPILDTSIAALERHKARPWVKTLVIKDERRFSAGSAVALTNLIGRFPNMERIQWGIYNLTADHWLRLFEAWPKLKSLGFEQERTHAAPQVTALQAISTSLPTSIRELDIYADSPTYTAFGNVPSGWWSQLTSLKLYIRERDWPTDVEMAVLSRVLRACSSLSTLHIRGLRSLPTSWFETTFGDAKRPCCPDLTNVQLDRAESASIRACMKSWRRIHTFQSRGDDVEHDQKIALDMLTAWSATIEVLDVSNVVWGATDDLIIKVDRDVPRGLPFCRPLAVDATTFLVLQTLGLAPRLRTCIGFQFDVSGPRSGNADFEASLFVDWSHRHPLFVPDSRDFGWWPTLMEHRNVRVTAGNAKEFAEAVVRERVNDVCFSALEAPAVLWSSFWAAVASRPPAGGFVSWNFSGLSGVRLLDDDIVEQMASATKESVRNKDALHLQGDIGPLSTQGWTHWIHQCSTDRTTNLYSDSDQPLMFESKTLKATTADLHGSAVLWGNIKAMDWRAIRTLSAYKNMERLKLAYPERFVGPVLDINAVALYRWVTTGKIKLIIEARVNVTSLEMQLLQDKFPDRLSNVVPYDPPLATLPWQRAIDDPDAWA